MSGGAPEQLILDLAHRPALGAEDFIVSASNEIAVAAIDGWPGWATYGLILVGPGGAGKSHLGHVWQKLAGTGEVVAARLDEPAARTLADSRGGLIEDIDRGVGDGQALFHLMNEARERGFHLLFTARTAPGDWEIALPDLRSRLRALPIVHIGAPDEQLLAAVLVKLLTDRQLPATPTAVSHLAKNLDRSMASALAVVAELDRMVWQSRREVTREMAKRALATVTGRDGDEE